LRRRNWADEITHSNALKCKRGQPLWQGPWDTCLKNMYSDYWYHHIYQKIRHEYIPNSSENLEGRGGGQPIIKHKIKHVL